MKELFESVLRNKAGLLARKISVFFSEPGCRASSYVNGHFLETYKGAVVNVVCNLGYTLIGASSTVYCNGTDWNVPFPECKGGSRLVSKLPVSMEPFLDNLGGTAEIGARRSLTRRKCSQRAPLSRSSSFRNDLLFRPFSD